MKKVLIAHQSGIPHYRVPFYNELARQSMSRFHLDVVSEPKKDLPSDPQNKSYISTLDVQTRRFQLFGRTLRYQTFLRQIFDYDLVILEHALNNLSYPLAQLGQFTGLRVAYWGHGRDVTISEPTGVKSLLEGLKLWMAKRATGYFAYTQGVKTYLMNKGIPGNRIFVIDNTIDINAERKAYEDSRPLRSAIRRRMGLTDSRVLLFVGRFTRGKRIDYLLKAFTHLNNLDRRYTLLLVGDGDLPSDQEATIEEMAVVRKLGTITEREELAPIYLASDLFVFPGEVGLGPLQALCYNLPVIAIDSPTHKPEFEYLSEENSFILPRLTNAEIYAYSIHQLFEDPIELRERAESSWPSISHLTIENMASKFMQGIEKILGPDLET